MLSPAPHFVEVVTWKQEFVEGVWRYWSNSYQFQSYTPFSYRTAEILCHNIATAEQFMYQPSVHQFGFMCWEWSELDRFSTEKTVYVWPDQRYGNRPTGPGTQVIEWEYALLYQKEAPLGHSGRMAFRRCLFDWETVPYRENGRAIPGPQPYGIHMTNLILFYLNNCNLEMGIWQRLSELNPPTTFRPVVQVTMGSLTAFKSIEDAQARKTPRAQPYELYWKGTLPILFAGLREIYGLVKPQLGGMDRKDIEKLEVLAMTMKGTFTYLSSYWTEGIKPVVMPNWRPTSGLDPLSLPCQQVCGDAIGRCDGFAPIINELYNNPALFIPLEDLMPFIELYSLMLLWMERLGAMRWTGTPIRGLPKVYE